MFTEDVKSSLVIDFQRFHITVHEFVFYPNVSKLTIFNTGWAKAIPSQNEHCK